MADKLRCAVIGAGAIGLEHLQSLTSCPRAAAVAVAALEARKHVLLEKPMATNVKEAAKILNAAKKMKRMVMVAQNFRFNRHTQMAKMLIERGDLGEIYHARCFWLRRGGIPRIGSWFTQKRFAGGGCTYDIGVHLLDACLHLLKDFEAASVSAQTHAKCGPGGLRRAGRARVRHRPARRQRRPEPLSGAAYS